MQLESHPSLSYDLHQWSQGYQSQPHEYDYWIEDIEGEIPQELDGTLLRNGPGLLDIGGYPIAHPFDGDGMISAIAFREGRAHYRNRYVQTQGYVEEQKAGKPLYRGVFGTQKPGGWLANLFDLRLKNLANTHIIYWADRLLALWEGAEPHRLDPQTLDTFGLEHFDGLLKPGQAFSAHPKIDPHGDRGKPCLVNFSIQPGLNSKITVWELNLKGKLLRQSTHEIPGFCFIHDFAITPQYYLFLQNPVSFNPLPFLFGLRGPGECINFDRQNLTKVWVIPRSDHESMKMIEIDSGFVFHHVNAFEEGTQIILDSIGYDSFPEIEQGSDFRYTDFHQLAPSQLWRFRLDLTHRRGNRQLLESRCCEFPQIHPQWVGKCHRYVYLGAAHHNQGSAPLQGILKRDNQSGETQFWSNAPHGFVSEPVFISKPGSEVEDQGWLISVVYESQNHRSDIIILDAQNLEQGPIGKLHLQHHIPYGLHGSWVSKQQLGMG